MNGDDNSSAKKPGDDEQILEDKCEDFDDIAQYFSKNEWEKLKYSEKSTYAYIKENYESLRRLVNGPKTSGRMILIETLTLGIWGLFPQIMPGEPPEEKENDSEAVPETSGTQNDVKPPCYPLCTSMYSSEKPSTSEKMDKIPEPKRAKHAWTHRLRERKTLVIYEEISDPEEDDE
ncbi:putative protein SSX9 [Aotus nancymaae]|uniref:putative protein SSX9 n=1 Tax=Aotus nancymaae TaxID=37293 RepID=UPI0030FEFDA4